MPSKIHEKSTHTETDHYIVSEYRYIEKPSRNKPQKSPYTKEEEMMANFSIAKLDI